MTRRRVAVLVGMLSIGVAGVVSADEGWGLSKLNPFKKKAPPAARARASVADSSRPSGSSRATTAPWLTRSSAPTRKAEPSTLEKVNQGTKDFFGKTKEVLMPWSTTPQKPAARTSSKSAKSSSWFSSWWPEKKKEPEIRTVNDFLGLERPQF